ncbi:MAG: UDP binding domain-containing protein, partial [Pirellula sp.]
REVNNSKPHHVVELVRRKASRFKEPIIACLGLAFKADVDDVRESPAIEIVLDLVDSKVGRILVVEPNIKSLPKCLDGRVEWLPATQAIEECDIALVLVDHRQFRSIPRRIFDGRVVLDTRGLWE